MSLNIMFDPRPMYPRLYHFVLNYKARDFRGTAPHYSRTRRPCKYYWTDFGLSRRYKAEVMHPVEIPILGGDRTVPEFIDDESVPRNPFPTDVYYLGNLIREDFLQVGLIIASFCFSHSSCQQRVDNLEFIRPLVESMTQKQPDQRLTMGDALRDLDRIVLRLPWWKLRERLRRREDDHVMNFLKDVQHFFRSTTYILLFLPPIPMPRDTLKQAICKPGRLARAVTRAKHWIWRKPSTDSS